MPQSKTSIATALLALCLALPAAAQMKTGEQMKNFDAVFGVKSGARLYDYDALLLGTSEPGAIFSPGQTPRFKFQIRNRTAQPIRVRGRVDALAYGTRAIPGDIWTPEVYKIADLPDIAIDVSIAAQGFQNFEIEAPLAPRMGGQALVVDLGAHGRRFLTSYVRTFDLTDKPRVQYPQQGLENLGGPVLNKLGVQAIRHGVAFVSPDDKAAYAANLERIEREMKDLHENKVTAMVEFGEGGAPMPLGRPRPHLTDEGVMKGGKKDYVWLPSQDDNFEAFVKLIATKYGWPRGPVTGMDLWNEPWEGISISGWQADIPRYQELTRRINSAVAAARREGADVLVGGADSSSNAWDKYFADGIQKDDEFLPYFDFVSIHYQGLNAPALHPQWRDRKDHKGRVKVWDTESWVANTDDRVAGAFASFRAAGYDRSLGIYGGNVAAGTEARDRTQRILTEQGEQTVETPVTAWSAAASVAAVQKFIGERPFERVLFENGLPWVYVFGGEDDGVVVVLGDLSVVTGEDSRNTLFRTVRSQNELREKEKLRAEMTQTATPERRAQIEKLLDKPMLYSGAQLTLPAAPQYGFFDYYGNPISHADGLIEIPLDTRGFYLKPSGRKGSMKALLAALKNARVAGLEPLEMIPLDFTAPLASQPSLRVRVTNVLPQKVNGTFSARMDGIELRVPPRLSLAPNETRVLDLPIVRARVSPANLYPLALRFDGGRDGIAQHDETMRVNWIARRTIQIDGDLSDWNGVLPQTIRGGDTARSLTEAAWLPMVDFAAGQTTGLATGYLAYDDDYFYFGAKIADDTPDVGTLRFAQRYDSEFFYPPVSYQTDEKNALRALLQKGDAKPDDTTQLRSPSGDGRTANRWVNAREAGVMAFAYDLKLPADKTHQVALYVAPGGNFGGGGMSLELQSPDGKRIASEILRPLYDGVYAIFNVRGDARLIARARADWYDARASGLFIDAAPNGAKAGFVKFDYETKGDWKNVYGALGHSIAGFEPQLPARMSIAMPDNVEREELKWPDGVRRFTYRTNPKLPSGNGSGSGADNVQIAFNAIPVEKDEWLPNLPGRPMGFTWYKDTDYEYALNTVAPRYGGGSEVWRLQVPQMPRKQFYPRQPQWAGNGVHREGAVEGAQLVTRYEGNARITEAAIPWRELPDVAALMRAKKPVKFSFRVNHAGGGPTMELAGERGVARTGTQTFHVDWVEHWANELEFGWE